MKSIPVSLLVSLAMCSLATAQPKNDDCLNAIEVFEGLNPHTNVGATGQTDLMGFCDLGYPDDIIYNNVFYTFTAPTTGSWEFRISLPNFVWKIAVYDGGPNVGVD